MFRGTDTAADLVVPNFGRGTVGLIGAIAVAAFTGLVVPILVPRTLSLERAGAFAGGGVPDKQFGTISCRLALTLAGLGVLVLPLRTTLLLALTLAGRVVPDLAAAATSEFGAHAATGGVVVPLHHGFGAAVDTAALAAAGLAVVEGKTLVGAVVAAGGALGQGVDQGGRRFVVEVVDSDIEGVALALGTQRDLMGAGPGLVPIRH